MAPSSTITLAYNVVENRYCISNACTHTSATDVGMYSHLTKTVSVPAPSLNGLLQACAHDH